MLTALTRTAPIAQAAAGEKQENDTFLSYIVLEQDSGQILYTQNAKVPGDASLLSRLMCAVVVAEYSSDGKKVLVTDAVSPKENSTSRDGKYKLYAGSTYTVGSLMKAMLLGGADNCARVLADFINPNTDYFVTLMNQTASRLEMSNTYFTSPDGEYGTVARTTVEDFAVLYGYALTLPSVRNVIQSEFSHIWDNTAVFNLCTLPFALKNTYGTMTAGGLFMSGSKALFPATAAVNITLPESGAGDLPLKLIAIVQDSVSDDQLNTLLSSLISDSGSEFHKTRVYKKGEQVASYELSGQSLSLIADEDVYFVVPTGTQPSVYIESVNYSFENDDYNSGSAKETSLKPPLTEGQKLGTVSLLLRDGSTHIMNISAGNTIRTVDPRFNKILNLVETYRPLFVIIFILAGIELFVGLVIVISFVRRAKAKKELSGKESS